MSMIREVLRDGLQILIFLDWGCAIVLLLCYIQTTFLRIEEYWERCGSLFSLRRSLPSQFSAEYYASYRRSVWLGMACLGVGAAGLLLHWLDVLIFGGN